MGFYLYHLEVSGKFILVSFGLLKFGDGVLRSSPLRRERQLELVAPRAPGRLGAAQPRLEGCLLLLLFLRRSVELSLVIETALLILLGLVKK